MRIVSTVYSSLIPLSIIYSRKLMYFHSGSCNIWYGIYCIIDMECVSECWRFYAVQTASVIFTAKTSSDVFSLRQDQVWTFSVFGDRIYEMRCLFVAGDSMSSLKCCLTGITCMSYIIDMDFIL